MTGGNGTSIAFVRLESVGLALLCLTGVNGLVLSCLTGVSGTIIDCV